MSGRYRDGSEPKIAVAGFYHETNTFSPHLTPASEFERPDGWPAATRGRAIFDVFSSLNLAIGGFITEGTDFDLLPILWTSAEPAGLVTDEAFEAYTSEICEAVASTPDLNGILLELHGAMVTQSHTDGELEIMRRLRAVTGPDLPIVTALDFHANLSADFVDLCSGLTLYRQYPHLDMAQTGARAVRLMRHILASGPLERAFIQLPFLISLSSQATTTPPLDTVYHDFAALEGVGVLSVDAASGFPAADIPDCGPSVVAFGLDKRAVTQAAGAIATRFRAIESALPEPLLSEEEAVRKAARMLATDPRPVILADVQDNTGGGATGDTTGLLEALISLDLAPATLGIIADPEAVALAWDVGSGGQFSAILGNKTPIPGATPRKRRYSVLKLSDEPILCTGAMYGGTRADLGRMALLEVEGTQHPVRVMIAEGRFQCVDLALLRHMGLTLEASQMIVVKSTAHFRADFEPISQGVLLVESPGLLPCRLETIPYRHLRPGVRIPGKYRT